MTIHEIIKLLKQEPNQNMRVRFIRVVGDTIEVIS